MLQKVKYVLSVGLLVTTFTEQSAHFSEPTYRTVEVFPEIFRCEFDTVRSPLSVTTERGLAGESLFYSGRVAQQCPLERRFPLTGMSCFL